MAHSQILNDSAFKICRLLESVAYNLISYSRRDKHAEALEVEYLVEDLVEAYSQALPQVS